MTKSEPTIRVKGQIDRYFFILVILLICYGSVMVFSAGFVYAASEIGDTFYFIKWQTIFACIGIALMFVYIFATAILTEWKDLSEFNKNERLGFYIFCIAEAITFFVTMLIANKTGKKILSIEKTQYDVRKRIIETSALLLGNVIKIYSDEEYRIRVTLFGYPNSDSVYYTVESIGYDYLLNKVNESQILEDTKHLPEEFESLIDISEKFGL